MSDTVKVSRRGFVVLTTAIGGGLTLGLAPEANAHGKASRRVLAPDASPTLMAQPFLNIAADGTVTVLAKHLDMGQGIWTGLAAIVAEELDSSWAQVRVEGAPADKAIYKHTVWGIQTTGGSTSTSEAWDQMRRAGATARAMLVAAAALRWSVPAAEIEVSDGVVKHAGGRQSGFADLARLAAAMPVPAQVTLKDPKTFKLLGHGHKLPRLDSVEKSTGAAIYAIDIHRPGMRVAVLQRAPRFGAIVRSFDDRAARAVPGVVAIVQIPNGVAVIATNTWAAMRGRKALVVDWDESAAEKRSSKALSETFRQLASDGSGLVCLERGHASDAMAGAAQVVELDFELPYLAHAPMEPLCSVGEFKDGRCEIWAGIQNQTTDQSAAARILGLEVNQVVLNTLYAGGSFGRRATFSADWISELAQLLKATNGAYPVKLMWTREDDITGGFYRPMNVHRLRAGLAADGRMLAIEQTIVAQSFLFGRPQPGVAQKPDPTVFEGHVASRYDVPDARLRWVNPDVGVTVQMYRALSHNHTTYSKEVLIDELARRTRRDALEYRLAHLGGHPRQAAVLKLAAEKAGWSSQPWPAGVALGLAVQEANNGTFIAQVAQVRIVDKTIRVERVVCAVDCGITLNPDIVRAQIEGGIGFGLGAALHGRISLLEGKVEQSNFHDFQQLRMHEMPTSIDVHFIDGGTAPTGIGEPGSVLVAAAVANAIAHITGHAICQLPFEKIDA